MAAKDRGILSPGDLWVQLVWRRLLIIHDKKAIIP